MKAELVSLFIVVLALLACGPPRHHRTYVLSPEQASHPSRIENSKVHLPDGRIGFVYECAWPAQCFNVISEFCNKRINSPEYSLIAINNSPTRPYEPVSGNRKFGMIAGCAMQNSPLARELCYSRAQASISHEEGVNMHSAEQQSSQYKVVTFVCEFG